ncbi:putative HTH-type transcriptional regulator [Tepidimonas alkaliphilus]|uniref:Putative HTH-type transcriptional regulator n=1 Tax=Tepidimonas alkaliphilus TaxID=2588942 RepID=A0A554WB78_9BURK|nr:AraC family transcriptional regulator [Tepidimonas alkaliphilus]TSE20833.1 putative HTH-type transcriptional regulator [Tepidimonas alkaliphilus]
MSPDPQRPSRRRAPVAATPMAFVRAIALGYRLRGADPTAALREAGLGSADLRDAQARLTSLPFERLALRAMRELDDEALGWFTRRLPWGSYGMLARASLTAPTLGVALARWCRHHALLTDEVVLTLQRDGAVARLTLHERVAPGAALPDVAERAILREFAHVSLLRNALGLSAWWIDARLPLLELDLAFAPPAHADVHALLFPGARLRYQTARTEARLAAAVLEEPLRRDEAALRAMLPQAIRLMVRPYRHDRLLLERARLALRAQPGADTAQLAALLHVSPRTLQRQLAAAGTTLHALRERVRQELAEQHLLRTAWPVKRVAAAVGFANDKSFQRAFRAWTGCSPAAWRERARRSAGDDIGAC